MGWRERYSEILGVSPNAGIRQIKRAYRKLAKKYHPDLCDDPDAAKRFVRIKEAYKNLLAFERQRKRGELRRYGVYTRVKTWQPPPSRLPGHGSMKGAKTPAEMARGATDGCGGGVLTPLGWKRAGPRFPGESWRSSSSSSEMLWVAILVVAVLTGFGMTCAGIVASDSPGYRTDASGNREFDANAYEEDIENAPVFLMAGLLLCACSILLLVRIARHGVRSIVDSSR